MTDYDLAQSMTYEYAETRNTLGIEPMPLGGGMLHVVNSGVVALPETKLGHTLRHEDGNRLVREASLGPVIAFADMVGLWPRGRHGAGEAALYGVQVAMPSVVWEAVLPFVETATKVAQPYPSQPYSFFGRYYREMPNDEPRQSANDSLLLSAADVATGIPVHVAPGSTLRVEHQGTNELDRQREVDISISGGAFVRLRPFHFLRVSSEGIHSSNREADEQFAIDIPHVRPQAKKGVRIPIDAEVIVHKGGWLGFASQEPAEATGDLNPLISSAEIRELAAPWNLAYDATGDFLQEEERRHRILQLFKQAGETEGVAAVRQYGREAVLGALASSGISYRDVGCATVAARLGALPELPINGWTVSEDYLRR